MRNDDGGFCGSVEMVAGVNSDIDEMTAEKVGRGWIWTWTWGWTWGWISVHGRFLSTKAAVIFELQPSLHVSHLS